MGVQTTRGMRVTWPPKSENPDALASIYNRAYEAASCDRGDSAEEAHQAACEVVHREGFMHATGGRVEHPGLTELREAAREILFEFPDEGDDDDADWARTRERRDRLQRALEYLARVQGRGEGPVADLRTPLWGRQHGLPEDLEALVRDQMPQGTLPEDISDPISLVQWLIDTIKDMRDKPRHPRYQPGGTLIHSHASKAWVKDEIRLHGPDAVLTQKGLTVEQAFKIVDECSTEFVPIGDCDNRDARGVCKGHPQPKPSRVSFLTDDEPESDSSVRLHVLAADDYWLSVGRGPKPPMDAFRACTSGARDSRITFLFAALYKLGRDDIKGARSAAIAFIEQLGDDMGDSLRWDSLTRECLTIVLGWFDTAIGDSEVSEKVRAGLAWARAVAQRDQVKVDVARAQWKALLGEKA